MTLTTLWYIAVAIYFTYLAAVSGLLVLATVWAYRVFRRRI